ncbi:PCI-domain-containing protein [Hortaea werneckii]|nr:PCI-domain-containing protein [Hortaea werneckii]
MSPSRRLLSSRLLLRGLNPRHHLLLGNQVIDPLQQTQEGFHVARPLVQNLVCIAFLLETDDAGGAVDARVDRLGGDEVGDVLLRLRGGEVEELRQARKGDARVVFGDDADVVLDDALAEVEPALVALGFLRVGLRGEDVGAGQLGPEVGRDRWPAHELRYGEEFEKLAFGWTVGADALQGEVDYALQRRFETLPKLEVCHIVLYVLFVQIRGIANLCPGLLSCLLFQFLLALLELLLGLLRSAREVACADLAS